MTERLLERLARFDVTETCETRQQASNLIIKGFLPLKKGGQEGFASAPNATHTADEDDANAPILPYNRQLKPVAHGLRRRMTDAERALWARLRRKQIHGVQFYRQRPLGNFIVDFYAPSVHLVIEVDGSQHLDGAHRETDVQRTAYLNGLGLRVVRFNNLQVLKEMEAVLRVIEAAVAETNPS